MALEMVFHQESNERSQDNRLDRVSFHTVRFDHCHLFDQCPVWLIISNDVMLE